MPYKDAGARRRYAREWRAQRRALFLQGHRCGTCGAAEGLEFHHRDPAEKLDHRVWTWSMPRIAAELAKCVVLCGACHRELHAVERRAPCGTNAAYRRGCHCPACRAAHAAANRRSRLLRGATA